MAQNTNPGPFAPEKSSPHTCYLLGMYLAFVSVSAVRDGFHLALGGSPWEIGDWIINYSGGFVRRGLIGSLILMVARSTHLSFVWVTFALEVAWFLFLMTTIYRLIIGVRWSYAVAALFLSPATIAFFALNPTMGFRKDILLLAGLAVLASQGFSQLEIHLRCAIVSVFVVALVLSHEALVIYLPYFAAAVFLQQNTIRSAMQFALLPVLSGLIAIVAVTGHLGNIATARAVCSSVGGVFHPFPSIDPGICAGSIEMLPLSIAQSHRVAMDFARVHNYRLLYGLLVIPSLTPAVFALISMHRRDKMYREVAIISWCSAISVVGTLLLFSSSIDWGRWIHLHAFCLLLTILCADRLGVERRFPSGPGTRHRWPAVLALFLFATLWNLPAWGGTKYTGYWGRFQDSHFLNYFVTFNIFAPFRI